MRDRPSSSDSHRRLVPGIKPAQVVDHVNENKTDASPANLRPMGRGQHTAQHNRSRGLSKLRKALRMVNERKRLY